MIPAASPLLAALALALQAAPAQESARLEPPVARRIPVRLERHGHVRIDPYCWLAERDSPDVLAYLRAENGYTEAMMARTQPLQERLFAEIKGRIVEDDSSAPYRVDDWWYYTRYEIGSPYPYYCRKHRTLDAPEQVLLDVTALAQAHGYFSVRGVEPNDDHAILAYAADTVGRRMYTIRFKDLQSGELLPESIQDATGNLAWSARGDTLFYARQDPKTLRSHRIYRHVLGTDPADDPLVWEETDATFGCYVSRTRSRRFLLISSSHTLRSEVRYLAADDPTGEWRVLESREADHDYDVDHQGERWLIRTNWKAPDFRLMSAPLADTTKDAWQELLAARDGVLLESIAAFEGFLVASERSGGLTRLRIVPNDGTAAHCIEFGESAYDAALDVNPTYATDTIRYAYASMTTPRSIYDYDTRTRERVLRKQDVVLGGFRSSDWVTERLEATARDGAKVPISIVHRAGMVKDGSHPLLLYGYGSYGATIDASFEAQRLSLLERGFVFAIAHVRGGQIRGRRWYEDGKLLKKKNTFNDFIDAAEFLIAQGYTSKERLFAQGGSAGGLLIGATVNMRPDLFAGAIAGVPFVDVVTTMLDESIPLTTAEYDEWGDPRRKEHYDYMLSYSPYDNVAAQAYPHLLVTTGLHDSQVQYWEPAKWVAKLRATKTDDHRLLLKTDFEAGHGGASGRYDRYRERAFEYAFLLDLCGISE
jgi:oligopeptidase B